MCVCVLKHSHASTGRVPNGRRHHPSSSNLQQLSIAIFSRSARVPGARALTDGDTGRLRVGLFRSLFPFADDAITKGAPTRKEIHQTQAGCISTMWSLRSKEGRKRSRRFKCSLECSNHKKRHYYVNLPLSVVSFIVIWPISTHSYTRTEGAEYVNTIKLW